jgi:hypothetical protein
MSNVSAHVGVLHLYEGQSALFRARLIGIAGVLLTQATTNSIAWTAYDLSSSTPTVVVATGAGVIANAVYNTPSNEDWPFPDGGANFALAVPAGSGAGQVPWKGLHRYRVRITVEHDLLHGPAANLPDGPFVWEEEVQVLPGFAG